MSPFRHKGLFLMMHLTIRQSAPSEPAADGRLRTVNSCDARPYSSRWAFQGGGGGGGGGSCNPPQTPPAYEPADHSTLITTCRWYNKLSVCSDYLRVAFITLGSLLDKRNRHIVPAIHSFF